MILPCPLRALLEDAYDIELRGGLAVSIIASNRENMPIKEILQIILNMGAPFRVRNTSKVKYRNKSSLRQDVYTHVCDKWIGIS
jgi:hypothetical protein